MHGLGSEEIRMHETKKGTSGVVSVLPTGDHLECFEIRENPRRRVYVSGMQKAPSPAARVRERAVSLYSVMDKVGSVIGFVAYLGMIYLLIRTSYGVLWI